jgi:putative transcriptional regulator
MNNRELSPSAVAQALGERLKQARLNADLTQAEVAAQAGLSRKVVHGAESGKVTLENMIAIMSALNLVDQLDLFLPHQKISPIQLAKLQGRKRQRASGSRTLGSAEEKPEW